MVRDSGSSFQLLDAQLATWATRLVKQLGIDPDSARALGSTIAREVGGLDSQVRLKIREGQLVRLADRLEELVAFQTFMDGITDRSAPAVVRAQVIVQNYVCFVYLSESCFRELRRVLPGGAAKRCCAFLTDNPIRAFRNALAHANWRYKADYSGLEF